MKANHDIFFCDSMLGSLAKWLRLLGCDCAYEKEIDDWELVRRCAREGRTLLTRDTEIVKRWQVSRGLVQAALVAAGTTRDQVEEVALRFGLSAKAEPRCPRDNSSLVPLPRADARDRVPPYVFETQQDYRSCPVCSRVYWKATHWERIDELRRRLPA